MNVLNVLVACEESQRVCAAFRELGHNAFSCDIQEPSGGHPEWHIKGDVLAFLNPIEALCCGEKRKAIAFTTMDDKPHIIPDKWDLIIAHPPCTYLSNVATRYHSLKCTPLEKINKRTEKRIEAMAFFMSFVNADCTHIAIENPRGVMNTAYRAADQTIDPFMFAPDKNSDEYVTKATCLWLKNLPHLKRTNKLTRPNNKEMFGVMPSGKSKTWEDTRQGSSEERAKERSKTFEGIATAMAEQWSAAVLAGYTDKKQLSLFEKGLL